MSLENGAGPHDCGEHLVNYVCRRAGNCKQAGRYGACSYSDGSRCEVNDLYPQTPFTKGSVVMHQSGALYTILVVPDNRKLEVCNLPFYEYKCNTTGVVWLRRYDEMEDGRFLPKEIA